MDRRSAHGALSRRGFLGLGAGAASVLAVGIAPPAVADARFAQRLALYNTHTDERLETMFWDGARFVPEAVRELQWLLRDWRTGQVAEIDLRLMLVLRAAARKVGSTDPFHVVSCFRSESTNLMLHRNDPEGVPEQSYHMYGMAIDVRLPGVPTDELRAAALWAANGNGGVGYYPRSDFIHIDTGRAPRIW